MNCITLELLTAIQRQYRLHWFGTYGVIHWSRVFEDGMKLAEQEGVNRRVVQLFSVFHDSRRENENRDKHHGRRGAELAEELRSYCPVTDDEFELLITACSLYTHTLTHENITVQVLTRRRK